MALEELPNAMRVTLLNSLGQVNLAGENYAAAERYLRQLLALPDQDVPSNQVLLAAALLGQERYADALEPLLSAVEGERAKGNQPRENWLSMLASIYYEINDYAAMRDVVEELVELYPREQYVMNLAALHGQLGDQGRQLALIESLLDDERLTQPTHLRMIVNLFLGEEMPHKAAVILERELDSGRLERNLSNLELLSQAWLLSAETENAIEPLAEAAELSESGELYLRLARLHMDAYRLGGGRGGPRGPEERRPAPRGPRLAAARHGRGTPEALHGRAPTLRESRRLQGNREVRGPVAHLPGERGTARRGPEQLVTRSGGP
jgi:tetratricopeptide (TPR) repeat protein